MIKPAWQMLSCPVVAGFDQRILKRDKLSQSFTGAPVGFETNCEHATQQSQRVFDNSVRTGQGTEICEKENSDA